MIVLLSRYFRECIAKFYILNNGNMFYNILYKDNFFQSEKFEKTLILSIPVCPESHLLVKNLKLLLQYCILFSYEHFFLSRKNTVSVDVCLIHQQAMLVNMRWHLFRGLKFQNWHSLHQINMTILNKFREDFRNELV